MDVLLSMSVFRRVAETGNFSEVAREMDISQPTVSKHVAALERHLSIKLLNRSTRQLSLTEVGKQYYDRCIHILDELIETESLLRNQESVPTGTLRINTPVTFGEICIVPHLWQFLDKFPELTIDLIMDDHYVDLVKDGIDVAIRIGPMPDSALVAKKLGDSPRVVFASPSYLKQRGEPKKLQDLQKHNCIVYTLLTTRNEWHFIGPNGEETVRVNGRFSANNPRTICDAVIDGQGIAVAPLWLVNKYIETGQVKVVLENYVPTPLEIHAVFPGRRYVPAKVRCFIEYFSKQMS